jgi:hypothetical protein
MSDDFANIPALSPEQGTQPLTPEQEKQSEKVTMAHTQKYKLIRTGNPKYLAQFVKDPDAAVRKQVAKYGGLKYQMQLIHDPDDSVRIEVAKNGDKNIATLMLRDPNATVQRYVKQTLSTY